MAAQDGRLWLLLIAGCREITEADELFRRFSKPNSNTMKL
ncbi:MAG: hypothetical protein DDT34_01786 [Firmicutes bacterium]|nr:hypothetical protein [Bacillota bacterium]